jgi:hypothetical protein
MPDSLSLPVCTVPFAATSDSQHRSARYGRTFSSALDSRVVPGVHPAAAQAKSRSRKGDARIRVVGTDDRLNLIITVRGRVGTLRCIYLSITVSQLSEFRPFESYIIVLTPVGS